MHTIVFHIPKRNDDHVEPLYLKANLMSGNLWRTIVALSCLFVLAQSIRSEDAIDRLKLHRLREQRAAIEVLQMKRHTFAVDRPYQDFRANLHVHSAFSHDSRGKIEQIVASAKAAHTQVLMFTEHPAPHYDIYDDGHRGIRDGVLMIPGAEMNGFLVFPKQSPRDFAAAEKQEFSDIICGRGGMIFISHLEERMDWEISGVTGCEIYNTHADFKDEKRMLASLKNPLWLLQAKAMCDKYPQEALSALLDYPSDYLKRYDQLCQIHPHTGISANDAHQNVGLIIRLSEGDKVAVENPLGEVLLMLDRAVFAAVQAIPDGTPVGTELFRLQLDPYENSLKHVGTHLLMKELSVEAVWEALNAGRAFVAFDWMADSNGFDLSLNEHEHRFEMGSQVAWQTGMSLHAVAPHAVHWKVFRNGEVDFETNGEQFSWSVARPGVYRVEAWLELAGKEQIWILANPFYVRN